MNRQLVLAVAVVALAAGQASAAQSMKHKPMHHRAVHHATMTHKRTAATYGAPNRRPLSSGDAPTTPREGHVADPLGVPGSDAAIYNWSPDDRNSAYGY